MRNIEIKTIVSNLDEVKSKAAELSGSEPEIIQQVDTFYGITNGRLKLREFSDGTGELIYYERANTKGPKLSEYIKTQFSTKAQCDGINKIMCVMHGYLGVVRKTRLLYKIEQSRIHIDEVMDLGSFMEIEVVLDDDQDVQAGEKISNDLMAQFNIGFDDLISSAYIDLLLDRKKDKRE